MREPAKSPKSRVKTRTRESGKPTTRCKGAGFPRGGCGFGFFTHGLPVIIPNAVEPGLSMYASPGDPWDDWEYSDAGVARGALSDGDRLLGVYLCGPTGVYMTVRWERERGTREGKYTWGCSS